MELWHEVAGDGPPVLLLHEGIGDSRMWDAQWETFPQAHRTVRCDLRGYGRTPMPAQTYSSARDVIELLERLALGPVAIVGPSMGGRVALEIALARPDLVRRLVLVAPGLPDHDWSPEAEAYDEEETAAFERGDVEAFVEVNLRFWIDGPNRTPDEVDPGVRSAVAGMLRQAFAAGDAGEEEPLVEDLAARSAGLAVPVLLIVGTEDARDMHAIADTLEATIPGVRREAIAGAAHAPMMERPDAFDALVLPFLA